jgi:hypothetical protein
MRKISKLMLYPPETVSWRDATGKGQRLDMSTYVSNVDKFKVMTIEFSEWKKNEDSSSN